ncbi:hypothetical protein KIW84_031225 [Lathyrus oleraceus]|uniref:Uncharacterized protein n=1 Tax=Pisum sativum TaxID=3888 RepID=A0A9D4XRV5_PEA|nr:hypothetical protein KIW84_031225 [Pisum sativum]
MSSIKRRFAESIGDYLNRFRSLKARCFTQVPKHELVQMAVGGLDYSIRKKIDQTFVKSMSQLADRVRHLERLRDLVQKAIQEGRLKFAGRRMKIDADPLHQEEALFVEPVEINMVEITEYDEAGMLEQTGENPDIDIAEVYPRADEDLVDFLYRCKNKEMRNAG